MAQNTWVGEDLTRTAARCSVSLINEASLLTSRGSVDSDMKLVFITGWLIAPNEVLAEERVGARKASGPRLPEVGDEKDPDRESRIYGPCA
ncbi:MAG: hypothetical protein Q9184_006085 [Pyrenodesmia sp. 2 TL-2023]